jgi:methylenetetrahydrofolate dehydrogenase (NADP+) / methenyltetrahydrofolate cyclohydrolase
MANLLDGRTVAAAVREELKAEIAAFAQAHGYPPALACVLVGDDPASKVYVKRIGSTCRETGVRLQQVVLPAETTADELRECIRGLNQDRLVAGVIVQMPLPKHLPTALVAEALSPAKDVDGICPINAGLLMLGEPCFAPSTPMGGLELLKRYGIPLKGARAVVVGRSPIVGKPMANLLLNEHATVTICHSRTVDLPSVTRQADVLVAAIGKARMITGDMIKPGAAVVDFGINPTESGIVGDVDFEAAQAVAEWITPVPGGTGPMTNVILMRNTLSAARRQAGEAAS